jgi:5-methylcytosine-specific restriction endonuclease McrA
VIRVNRTEQPPQLTEEKHNELRDIYMGLSDEQRKARVTGSEPWREEFIKIALQLMSFGKCAYCETKSEAENFLTADHWLPKNSKKGRKYPEFVVTWTNLIPACGICNSSKSDHDPSTDPLVNPCVDDPREHLEWKLLGRLKDKTTIGEITIEAFNLNREKLVTARMKLANRVVKTIEDLENAWQPELKPTRLYRIRSGVRELLEMAQPDAKFSTLVASTLFTSEEWVSLRQKLRESNCWTEQHDELEEKAWTLAFTVKGRQIYEPIQKTEVSNL